MTPGVPELGASRRLDDPVRQSHPQKNQDERKCGIARGGKGLLANGEIVAA
jgi:hypothetical protein